MEVNVAFMCHCHGDVCRLQLALCKLFVSSFPPSLSFPQVLRFPAFPFSTGLTHAKGLALASVSIATVQASTPQLGPCLRFRATPLVPCPFAFQPNPNSIHCVAEQTLKPPRHVLQNFPISPVVDHRKSTFNLLL